MKTPGERGSGGGSSRTLVRKVASLVVAPRFPEPVPAEFYRLTGLLRFAIVLSVIATTFPIGFVAEEAGFRPDVYWRVWGTNSTLLGISGVLGIAMWKGSHPIERLTGLNRLSAVLEMSSLVVFIYASGTVNSSQTAYAIVCLLVYRTAFEFKTGALACLTLFLGLWGAVLLEISGVIPPQPLASGALDRYYGDPRLELSAMVVISMGIGTAWLTANWMVARFRQKELAMRELRVALAEREDGALGRHTGRLLRGTYQVGALIGVGGIGEVYRAVHTRTSREVALKILREHYLTEPRMLERFRREATILGKLGSPFILEIIDVDQQDELPFIAVELLIGETLQERLEREGALGSKEVARIVSQVGAGLDAAHAAGIVHRDLKPDNVFLIDGADGPVAKILDFGIAKIRDAGATMTSEGAILGTPAFMAPEQASGRTHLVDVPTDVHALGALAYMCACGLAPFDGGSLQTILFRVITKEPEPLHEVDERIPAAASAVVARALEKAPEDRWPSAGAMADALAEAFGVPRLSLPPPRPRPSFTPRAVDESAETVDASIGVDEDAETAERTPR